MLSEPVTITELQIQNFKILKAVRIDASGNMIVIGGANGAGKSSVLDSIAAVLGGKRLCPASPIRKGQERTTIRCKLKGNENYVVERTFYYSTSKPGQISSTLTIKSESGDPAPSPQKILDDLLGDGNFGFDPLSFTRLNPRGQLDQLRKCVGIDFTKLDAQRKKLYDDRHAQNLQVKTTQARVQQMPRYPDAESDVVDVSGLTAELRTAREQNVKKIEAASRVKMVEQEMATHKSQLDRLAVDHARITQQIERAELERTELEHTLKDRQSKSEGIKQVDTDELETKISGAAAENVKISANTDRLSESEVLTEQQEKSSKYTTRIDAIDAKKAAMIDAAKWPVDGLGFGSDGVTFNGLPFEQASQSEQLRISLAMALAAHPNLPVAIIRDGSLLDDKSLAMVAKIAAENGAQVFVERVGSGEECSLVIEDGEVAGADDPTADIEAEQASEDAAEDAAGMIP